MDSFSHLSPFFFLHDDKTAETLGSKNFNSTVKETEWDILPHGQTRENIPTSKGALCWTLGYGASDPLSFSDL